MVFDPSDFGDVSDLIGFAQRRQASGQLSDLSDQLKSSERRAAHAEEGKRHAVDFLIMLEDNANKLEEIINQNLEESDWNGVLTTAVANETIKNLEVVQVLPLHLNYGSFLEETPLLDKVRRMCGSSLDLRRHLEQQLKRLRTAHYSIPREQVKALSDAIKKIRVAIYEEKLIIRVAEFLKSPSSEEVFKASEKWVSLMNDIEKELTGAGLSYEKLCASTLRINFVTIDDMSPYMVTHQFMSGCLVDYSAKNQQFAIDKEACNKSILKFEYNKKLLPIEKVPDVSRIKRCYVERWFEDEGGEPRNWLNILMGWKGTEYLDPAALTSAT